MYYESKKRRKILFILVCIAASVVLCVSLIAKINEERRNSIALGTHISKNKLTETIKDIKWANAVNPVTDISVENDGKSITISGIIKDREDLITNSYLYNIGNNAIYYIPENEQEQTFNFSYNINFEGEYSAWGFDNVGSNLISAGVLLKVVKKDNTLNGYMLSFNSNEEYKLQSVPFDDDKLRTREWYYEAGGKDGAIWKFNWNSGTIEKTLVKAFDAGLTGDVSINTNAKQIIIAGTNSDGNQFGETIDIPSDEETGNGFGFFSALYDSTGDGILDYEDTIPHRGGSVGLSNFTTKIIDVIPYNLYVNPNGGTWKDSSEVSTITGKYKDEIDIPIPTREGYTFAGWTRIGESGTMSSLTENAVYTFGEDEKTENIITAQWIKNTSTDNPQKPGETDDPGSSTDNPQKPGDIDNPGGSTDNPQKPGDTDNPGGSTDNPQKPGDTDNPGSSTDNPQKPGNTDNPGSSTDNPQKPGDTDNPGSSTDNPQKPGDTDNPGSSTDNPQKPGDTDNPGSSTDNPQKPGDTDNPGSSSGNAQKPGDTDNPGSSSGNTQKPGDTDNPGSSSGNTQKPDDTNNQGGSTNNSQNLSGTNNSNKKDETITNQDKLPYTGVGIGLGVGVLLAGIFVIIMFKKVKYYKEI